MKNRFTSAVITVAFVFALALSQTSNLYSQSEGKRLAFGFNFGLNKYWGEFTDNQFWWGGDMFLRYNVVSQFSIMAQFSLADMRYKIDQDVIDKYPAYFGQDATLGDPYPGFENESNPTIQNKNVTTIQNYEVLLAYNFFSNQSFVPYVFAGAGMMNFQPKSGDTGYDKALPNNIDGKYEKTILSIPAGVGFELYITDNLVFNGRGTYRFVDTDYLDDLSGDEGGDDDGDKLLTFGLGFTYYILGDADYDKDGLTNDYEKSIGTDEKNPDTDGDGLKDGEEVKVYYTDPLKPDTDGDSLGDYEEVFNHKTSPVKPDTDSDGLKDGEELARKTNPRAADTDKDGLLDGDEVNKHDTNPRIPDSDEDGLYDGEEITKYDSNPKSKDTDSDGLSDGDEVKKYETKPSLADTDNDGLSDGMEANQYKTNPLLPDTDEDGINDGDEVNKYGSNPLKKDSDDDGLGDGDEIRKYKTNPILADTDKDKLSDGEEVSKYQTDPTIDDSDKDGLKDGAEIQKYKTDPNNPDTDDDKLADGEEIIKYKTDPNNPDTDNDKLGDSDEINLKKTDPLNPDTDGDTVIDGEDDCPHTPGEVSEEPGKNGCPAPPKVGTKTDFPDILFKVNSDDFNFDFPSTPIALAKLLEYINQCEGLQVIIEGHASAEGNKKRNQELSEMRAEKVREWLLSQGVAPEKITGTVGYGSSQPKVPEPTGKKLKQMSKEDLEALRKQNRRITVKVTKTCGEE